MIPQENMLESGGVPCNIFAQLPDYKFNIGICLTSNPEFQVDPLLNIMRVSDDPEERRKVKAAVPAYVKFEKSLNAGDVKEWMAQKLMPKWKDFVEQHPEEERKDHYLVVMLDVMASWIISFGLY